VRVSVAIAAYQRREPLRRLLEDLARQAAPVELEVCVVDDGSAPELAPDLSGLALPFEVRFERQANGGASSARNHAARLATGELLVFLDDDMRVGPDFVAAHARAHAGGPVVALGRIVPGERPLPLFERWHAHQIERLAESFRAGERPRGVHLYTGNVSLRRDDFIAAGGFDTSLPNSEDIELGLKLEALGRPFVYLPGATSRHESDHESLDAWRARAHRYGRCNRVVAQKHPRMRDANPWRLAEEAHPAMLPVIAASVLLPKLGARLAGPAYAAAAIFERFGLRQVAFNGVTAAFAAEFFAGLTESAGGTRAALEELRRFFEQFGARSLLAPPPRPAKRPAPALE
jgi:GT2 family glycosyltransferase